MQCDVEINRFEVNNFNLSGNEVLNRRGMYEDKQGSILIVEADEADGWFDFILLVNKESISGKAAFDYTNKYLWRKLPPGSTRVILNYVS